MRNQAENRRTVPWAALLTATLVVATLCAATASFFWVGDLAAHFRVQYALGALLCGIALAVKRRPLWAAVALCAAGVNAASVTMALQGLPAAPAAQFARISVTGELRLASINLFYLNRDFERVRSFVRQQRPDVVIFLEVNGPWRQELRALQREYPHAYATRGPGSRGLTLLSRWPIEAAQVAPIGEDLEPGIQASLRVRGRLVQVLAVHTRWPMGRANSAARNRQLVRLAALARSQTVPVIVIGDLNISPLSPHFHDFLAAGRLRWATTAFAWQPTWPRFFPPAGIQIDHCLVSRDVAVRRFERGAGIGSDHSPILLDVVLP